MKSLAWKLGQIILCFKCLFLKKTNIRVIPGNSVPTKTKHKVLGALEEMVVSPSPGRPLPLPVPLQCTLISHQYQPPQEWGIMRPEQHPWHHTRNHQTGSPCVTQTNLELTVWTRLALNSQRSACLCRPSAGIKGLCHHSLA